MKSAGPKAETEAFILAAKIIRQANIKIVQSLYKTKIM